MGTFRTDLAEELRSDAMSKQAKKEQGELDGIKYNERQEKGVRISTIDVISKAGEAKLSKKMGRYVTVSFDTAASLTYEALLSLCDIVAGELRALAGDIQSVLVCGLGNREITADAVGVLAAEHILATHHMKRSDPDLFKKGGFFDLSCLCPNVTAKTGMEAAEIVRGAVETLLPDAVVVMDALAARESSRLARTIQLSDTGISPGSGVGNCRAALDKDVLGVPVIAVGVPTVVDTATLVSDILQGEVNEEALALLRGLFVSPKEIDGIVKNLSRILSFAVNRAFHGDFGYEEMAMMA